MRVNRWLAAILACGIACAAWGQQSGPARAGDSGPSLAETMQILQSKLNEPGKLHWATHYHDNADATNWTYTFTFEVSRVVADAAACQISYHYKIERDGAEIADHDTSYSLHDVQDLALTTGDLRQNKNDVAAGHTTWVAKTDPNLFDLVVRGKENAEYYFFFTDEDSANRATKAMGHAVELCGGSRGSF